MNGVNETNKTNTSNELFTADKIEAVKQEGRSLVRECIKERSRFSRVFETKNGEKAAVIYPKAVHFKKGDAWEAIDNTLVLSKDQLAYENAQGRMKVRIARMPKQTDHKKNVVLLNLEEQQNARSALQDQTEEKASKKFFGKKDKKDKKDEKIEELTDRLTRQMAEFDNFRKRSEKEKSQMYEIGAKDIIEKILPVVDNFERGLAQAPEGDSFADGMKMIYKQLITTLDELGVKPIEAVGKEFDPNFHNAVMHVEDEEAGENIVVEEFQKGYTYKDFVVRHSMVKVAN